MNTIDMSELNDMIDALKAARAEVADLESVRDSFTNDTPELAFSSNCNDLFVARYSVSELDERIDRTIRLKRRELDQPTTELDILEQMLDDLD